MDTFTFTELQNFRASLNLSFLERTDVIDGVLASIITEQNCFLFGAPGTGKSELVREVSKGFDGSKFFSYLLSPTTDPSELYGPVAVSKLLEDEYTRDVSGYLPDSNIVFLDELFRGSSAVLNSLLQVLNERTFNNGKELIQTEIKSVVAATNSFPSEESLQAFCDRFLFRPTIEGLKKPTSKRKLYGWALGGNRPSVISKLTMDSLKTLKVATEQVEASDEFIDIFTECMDMLESRGIIISDRRRVQVLKFLRGWAIVQGEDTLHAEYLHSTLHHIVYQSEEDVATIKEVVDQVVPTADKFIRSAQRASNALMNEFNTLRTRSLGSIPEVNGHIQKLKKLLSDLRQVANSAESALDDGKMRFTPASRMKATKVCQEINHNIDQVAEALSRYQK
jgi:MoxR-like ATPase